MAAALDLLASAAAGLTVRWPRAAGVALALVLTALCFTPVEWSSMGEYAPLIPILGTGVRGQRRERLWMTVVYGAILAGLTFRQMAGDPLVWFGVGVWTALIAVLWVIGDLFDALRRAQAEAHAAVRQQERLGVARDLHDTVARSLTRASLRVQVALNGQPSPDLEVAVAEIQQASVQLRWMLALLRDVTPASADSADSGVTTALGRATRNLAALDFDVAVSVDGDLDGLPVAVESTLRAAIEEACANIEKHGDSNGPCAIIISRGRDALDAVFLNQIAEGAVAAPGGLGLVGLRERMALVGGELAFGKEGSQWISRVAMPL